MPHIINNVTYQESFAAFAASAKQAAKLGAAMNYGSQPITTSAVQASSDTPLGLTLVNQDCKCSILPFRSPGIHGHIRLDSFSLTSRLGRRGPHHSRMDVFSFRLAHPRAHAQLGRHD